MGATATGKTGLALKLAAEFDGEIVSADSALVYRGLDIGTAKPEPDELARIAHHVVDVRAPDQPFSVAEFQQAATAAIADIQRRQRLPFVVGGTGLYLRALLEGYTLPDAPPDRQLRARLEGEPLEHLVARLRQLDPEAASFVDLANPRRVVRAVEVCLVTGRRFSSFYHRVDPGYRTLKLGLRFPPEALRERIVQRTRHMVHKGLLEEVRGLVEKGYAPHLRRLKLIGYEEMLDVIEGRTSLDEGVRLLEQNTRRLAKRQVTWFGREEGVTWLEGPSDVTEQAARTLVSRFLKSLPGGRELS